MSFDNDVPLFELNPSNEKSIIAILNLLERVFLFYTRRGLNYLYIFPLFQANICSHFIEDIEKLM